jgi:uncharacterized protein YbjT (DUF2867 family)
MKIAVSTPAGNIGSKIVQGLLDKGAEVVMIALERHRTKLSPLAAELRIASSDSSPELAEALSGVSDLFWLTPPNTRQENMRPWFQRTAHAAAEAIKAAGVKRVVNLSSIGAGMEEGMGTLTYMGDVEKILNDAAPNIRHLRPGYFMENLLLQKSGIENGEVVFPFSPFHDLPWIAAKDIAAAAVNYLLEPSWRGQGWHHLMGPENLSGIQLASALGVNYRQSTFEEIKAGFLSDGMSEAAAADLLDLFTALGREDGAYAMLRTYEAFTPTKVQDFMREH